MSTGESRFLQPLGRRAVPAVAVLVVLSYAFMAGLLVQIARNQNASSADQASHFVDAVLDRRREMIGKDAKDYAAWGEAYQHLHIQTDVDWAFNQQNLGPSLFHDLSYDDVLVIGPDDTITYAVVGGELVTPGPSRLLSEGLAALVKRARTAAPSESKPAVGFIKDQGDLLLVAASTITTGGDPTIVQTAGPPSVLVLGDTLTAGRLEDFGRVAFLNNLRLPRDEADADAGPSRLIATADGTGDFRLRWDPEQPGTQLLRRVLPWLGIGGFAFALLTALILRRATHAARLIQSHARALAEAHRLAEHSSLHDPVTELPNRLMLHEFLERRVGPSGELQPTALLFIDLDRFKPINDAFGHAVGDEVLRQVARRLRNATGFGDVVARVGGDEFVVALPDRTSVEEIRHTCLDLIEAGSEPIASEGASISIGLSIGVAIAPADGTTPELLLRHADIAMYEAKIGGGKGFSFFSGEMNARISDRLSLEQDLRRALDEGHFELHFQPQYETASMRLLGVEALLRLRHPTKGLLAPNAFIGVAEETGLIVPIGAWVLRRACAVVAGYRDLTVSVNVSPAQFDSPGLVDHVATALRASGLPGERLELELTESMLLRDVPKTCELMGRLKELGVCLAMDDFGTGYSSLGYLRRFPFDRLKIDQQFVASLHPAGEARAIVQAIVGLGRALNLSVTAEGVETAEQLLLLRADRCHEVQGYHLSRPVPEADLAGVLGLEAIPAPLSRTG